MQGQEYLNANGLVDGKIPAGQGCSFVTVCKHADSFCPNNVYSKRMPFTCDVARILSFRKEFGREPTEEEIIRKVRR